MKTMIDMNEYNGMLKNLNINIIYSGPMWQIGIKGIADMVQTRLQIDDVSENAAKSIFSVFVEQITNVLMYSVEKKRFPQPGKNPIDISIGTLFLGYKEQTYFIQTGNAIKSENAELLKNRIDYLNTLDKKGLRQYHRERMAAENDNPESQGAGLGLIEIARRATAPIEYRFEPIDESISYFTMYVEIEQERKGE
jgi:hypothetical protein